MDLTEKEEPKKENKSDLKPYEKWQKTNWTRPRDKSNIELEMKRYLFLVMAVLMLVPVNAQNRQRNYGTRRTQTSQTPKKTIKDYEDITKFGIPFHQRHRNRLSAYQVSR